MVSTITLTNAGTLALILDSVGSINGPAALQAAFVANSYEPICLVGSDLVNAISSNTTLCVNQLSCVNLDNANPLATIYNMERSPTVGGGFQVELGIGDVSYQDSLMFALGETVAGGSETVAYEWACGALETTGTLAPLSSIAGGTNTVSFFAPTGFPFANGGVAIVIDPKGIVYNTGTGNYQTAVTFFPLLNASPPAGATGCIGGYTDTAGGNSYLVVGRNETVSPYSAIAPITEMTHNGASVGTFQYAFNNSFVPGDVFEIDGTTPDGYFFIRSDGAAIIEVNPVAENFTTYTFTAGDSIATLCLTSVLEKSEKLLATKDNEGNWWLTTNSNLI